MAKPEHSEDYSPMQTELAERVLLEAWSRLGEYHDHLVLVGGLVPRYLVDQKKAVLRNEGHCGTMDVDLGLSIAIADLDVYHSIRQTLTDMGFTPGTNERGREQLHSFENMINEVNVSIDFLTTEYNGPQNSLMRGVQDELRAIQIKGLGLALMDPLKIDIIGTLLSGGKTTEKVNVCRLIPFIVLKALAFEKRREPKDSYDLVYVLRNAGETPDELAQQITKTERSADSFRHAMTVLSKRFSAIDRDGPFKYAQFTTNPTGAAIAFATVQDFLREAG
jgi:hypothetical protein